MIPLVSFQFMLFSICHVAGNGDIIAACLRKTRHLRLQAGQPAGPNSGPVQRAAGQVAERAEILRVAGTRRDKGQIVEQPLAQPPLIVSPTTVKA